MIEPGLEPDSTWKAQESYSRVSRWKLRPNVSVKPSSQVVVNPARPVTRRRRPLSRLITSSMTLTLATLRQGSYPHKDQRVQMNNPQQAFRSNSTWTPPWANAAS